MFDARAGLCLHHPAWAFSVCKGLCLLPFHKRTTKKRSTAWDLQTKGYNKKWTWQVVVTFVGWLSDPFQWLSDLQLGDEKVTLNHLGWNGSNPFFPSDMQDHIQQAKATQLVPYQFDLKRLQEPAVNHQFRSSVDSNVALLHIYFHPKKRITLFMSPDLRQKKTLGFAK